MVSTGATSYVLGVPSILASDILSSTELLDIVNNKHLVFNGYANLPANYQNTAYDPNGGFDFTPANHSLVAFSGDTDTLS